MLKHREKHKSQQVALPPQFCSSEKSPQSLSPSHRQLSWIHWPLGHSNSSAAHPAARTRTRTHNIILSACLKIKMIWELFCPCKIPPVTRLLNLRTRYTDVSIITIQCNVVTYVVHFYNQKSLLVTVAVKTSCNKTKAKASLFKTKAKTKTSSAKVI